MIDLIKQIRIAIYLLIALFIILLIIICWRFVPYDGKQFESVYYIVNIFTPLATVIFVIFTFKNQQQQLQTLKTQISKSDEKNHDDLIEQRFFLFLKIHRDNVASMSYENKEMGKGIFVKAIEIFKPIYINIDKYFDVATQKNKFIRTVEKKEKIEVAYMLLFYGTISSESKEILREMLGHFDELMHDHRRKFYLFVIDLCDKLDIKEIGMQSELSNYFRHFFHTVTYIHDLDELNDNEKRFYIKRLRGQLSNYEMALLLLNSESSIGRRWRNYVPNENKNMEPIDLIKKYELIKNLPPGFLSHLNIQDDFPDMPWEGRVHTSTNKTRRSKPPQLNPRIVSLIEHDFKDTSKAKEAKIQEMK